MRNSIVLIVTHNQVGSVLPLIEATKNFTRLWAVDRSTDNTIEILKKMGEDFVENTSGKGFLAGKTRDIGLDYILTKNYDTVVMLDGDRIPLNLTKELVDDEMKIADCSLAYCEKDIRLEKLTRTPELYIWASVATAGLIVKTKFLKKIRDLSFMGNRCFHQDFDGGYGEEDIFLGHCLYNVGANVIKSKLVVTGTIPSKTYYPNSKNITAKENLLNYFRGLHASYR